MNRKLSKYLRLGCCIPSTFVDEHAGVSQPYHYPGTATSAFETNVPDISRQ